MSEMELGLGDWFVARNGEVGVVAEFQEESIYAIHAIYRDGVFSALTTDGRVYKDGPEIDRDAIRKIPGPDHIPFDLDKWPKPPVDSGWRGPGLYQLDGGNFIILGDDDEGFMGVTISDAGVRAKFIMSWEQLLEMAAKA